MSQKKWHRARRMAYMLGRYDWKYRRLRQRIAWLEANPAWWQV